MYRLLYLPLFLLLISTFDCKRTPSDASKFEQNPVQDYGSLLNVLRSRSIEVEEAGNVSQPFFEVEAKVIKIKGGEAQIFEYENAHKAEEQSKLVSPNGTSIGTSSPMWISTPHFFRNGRLIAIYLGQNPEVLKALSEILGPQFAGQ